MPLRIGIDLDNTIADFRAVFAALAVDAGVVDGDAAARATREGIRAAVRAETGGENLWQQLQAQAYGPQMGRATVFPGCREFIAERRRRGDSVFVVSHRTEYAAADRGSPRTSLHDTARHWLAAAGLIGDGAIEADHVHLETSREAKIARIAGLDLDLFIDDLPEVLDDPAFPATTRGARFAPADGSDWAAITAIANVTAELAWAERVGGARVSACQPCRGGANARVLRIDFTDGRRFALKHYPANPWDEVDRFASERETLNLLADAAPGSAPRWMAGDPENRLAVLEWLPGEAVTSVSAADIDCLADFVGRLFAAGTGQPRRRFTAASAACPDAAAIERQIDQRLDALSGASNAALAAFLAERFRPALAAATAFRRAADPAGDASLAEADRRLVPADLGFHNALRDASGTLRFLDFEYTGWDDPARFIADFLLHPGHQLPPALGAHARAALLARPGLDAGIGRRLAARLPLFALRWSLIVLNEFLPARREARRLAGWRDTDWPALQNRQLRKADDFVARAEQFMEEPAHA